jgi:hypothetical protein
LEEAVDLSSDRLLMMMIMVVVVVMMMMMMMMYTHVLIQFCIAS